MKKIILFLACSAFLLSSCGTYTGSGAYAGASLGSILGSAIGGLSGGPRGSDLGTVIGMAGGAVVGATIGAQADQTEAQKRVTYQERRARGIQSSDDAYQCTSRGGNYSTMPIEEPQIFDSTNSGDDRIYDFDGKDYQGSYTAKKPSTSFSTATIEEIDANLIFSPSIEITNARFVDSNEDRCLNRNEICKLIFEIHNSGKRAVCDVVPTVVETTGNKHIFISPSIHVEKIEPGNTIRYTAMVKADNRLKNGMAKFCVTVVQGNKAITKVNQFDIPTLNR